MGLCKVIFLAGTVLACLFLSYAAATAQWIPFLGLLGLAGGLTLVLRWPKPSFLLWLILGPTLFTWVGAVVGTGIPALTPDRMLLVLLYAITAARWILQPATRLPVGRIEGACMTFGGMALVSAIVGGGSRINHTNPGGLWNDFVLLAQAYLIPFAVFYLAKNLLREDRYLNLLLHTITWTGLLVGAMGLFEFFTGIHLVRRFQVIQTTTRAVGTLGGPVEFGMMINSSLITAILLLVRARDLLMRIFIAGALAVMVTSVVLSQSRSVWVGFVVSLAVISVFEPRFRRPLAAGGIMAVVGLAMAWPLLAETEFLRYRVLQRSSIYNRVALSCTALNMIVHRPILGGGFGRYTFTNQKWPYLTSAFGVEQQFAEDPGVPHNEYLHLLVMLGLVGFIPYFLIYWWGWRSAVIAHRREKIRPGPRVDVLLAFFGIFAMYVMNAMAVDLIFFPQVNNLMMVMFGAVESIRLWGIAAPGSLPEELSAREARTLLAI